MTTLVKQIAATCMALNLLAGAGVVYAGDFTLTSKSFEDNQPIPPLYGCDGKNISPQLTWSNPPKNTQAYALTLYSPDWSAGFAYLWVVYNIPKSITTFAEGAAQVLPPEILVGTNYYHESSYRGPCPPDRLHHHYVFTVYALDDILNLSEDADPRDVMRQVDLHKLGEAKLTGQFWHKK